MNFQAMAIVVGLGWLVVMVVLQLEHAWWADLDFRIRYLMGMGTVCLGCLGVGVALDNVLLAVVPGVLATAGLPILGSYASEAKAARDKKIAQRQGEIVGMARGIRRDLTQEMIDKGESPHGNDPSRFTN